MVHASYLPPKFLHRYMAHYQLVFKTSIISYYRFGHGPKKAICFHGYGENAAMYAFLEKYAGRQFTFYSIDLPFHGNTKWNEGLTVTHQDLLQVCELILQQDEPEAKTNNSKLTLMGFSLGGRIALSLYQSQPAIIEKMVMLAPDGLKLNFWYWLATQSRAGNKFFALTMKHPSWFFGLLQLLNKLKLVNASIFKFVNFYIGDKEVRQLLYERWTALRKLKPNLEKIKSSIRSQHTQVRLVYGKHDRIILPVVGEKFRKGIENYSKLEVISSGHQVLHEKHAEQIVDALLH